MPPAIRPLIFGTTALCSLMVLGAGPAAQAEPLIGTNRNSFGMPGAVDTPTAEVLPDATLGAAVGTSSYARRNTLSFQATPRLTTALRYSKLDGVDRRTGELWDRSFDVHYQIAGEKGWRPAVAVGLRDFMGTGVYSSEYVVATKTLTPEIKVTAGVGWGRLAGAWRRTDYTDEGGKPKYDEWFTGTAKPFGSVAWQATDKLSLVAEYSNDNYQLEVEEGGKRPDGHLNFGVNYRLDDTYQISAYNIGGKVWGAQFSFAMNPRQAPFPSGLEKAPAPVRPRPSPGADPEGWSGAWSADPTAQPAIQGALASALRKEGQELQAMALDAGRAEVRIKNTRYLQHAEAIGRTARLMTRALPPSVESFVITSVERGMPTSSVTLSRADIEALESRPAAEIAQRASITDAPARAAGLVATPGLYPRYSWGIKPYVSTGLFDPDDPFRYEIGAELSGRYELRPGLVLSGKLRQRAFGTLRQEAPGSADIDEYDAQDADVNGSGVPRVRSDSRMYSANKKPTIPQLTLAWYARPTRTTYSRVTAGLLERGYGGVSAELLWKPVNSRLAVGAEINRVRKRDFRDPFKFRKYEVTTGHLSAYYDFGGGFWGQVDAGRYLAGDVGATVSLNREFANGWRIGAYATKTDLSDEEFGEGSFDKGITISIPIGWATGQPSFSRVGGNLRSLSRDGGSRVKVDGRLYETVRNSHAGKLYEGWGKFWR